MQTKRGIGEGVIVQGEIAQLGLLEMRSIVLHRIWTDILCLFRKYGVQTLTKYGVCNGTPISI